MGFSEDALYPNIKDVFKENNKAIALGVLYILEPTARIELEAKVVQKIFEPNSLVNSIIV